MSSTSPRTRAGSVLTEGDREFVRDLEEAATDLWGDEWAISIRRWADGDAQIYAEHFEGLTPEGHRKKERLMDNGDGGFGHDAVVVTRSETITRELLERDV